MTRDQALSLLQRGLAPRSKGKARAELRPARRQSRNESGQLVVFHLSSVIWCFYVVVTVSGPRDGRGPGSRGVVVEE